MTLRRRLALGVLLALAGVGPAQGQETEADRRFAADFVAAINSQSLDRRLALVHARARPCTAGDVGEWWRDAVARQARTPVPAKYTTAITPVTEPRPFGDRFDYPVQATHQLQIDYSPASYQLRAVIILLAKDGARWAEVVPCAKPDTVIAIRANQQARVREAERVKVLAAGTSPQLRETVVGLYRAGRTVEAYQTYARESGEELATARAVVELLAEGGR